MHIIVCSFDTMKDEFIVFSNSIDSGNSIIDIDSTRAVTTPGVGMKVAGNTAPPGQTRS